MFPCGQTNKIKLIDARISRKNEWDSLKVMNDLISRTNEREMIVRIYFKPAVKDIDVPQACECWVNLNLRFNAESIANDYMKNNFLSFFRKEVSENREVTGFITQHLQDVEQRVQDTAKQQINSIVENSAELNPILQSQLNILSKHNASRLNEQVERINAQMRLVVASLEADANRLRTRMYKLERDNIILAGVTLVSLIGVAFIGLSKL
jgi:hypothetical protein